MSTSLYRYLLYAGMAVLLGALGTYLASATGLTGPLLVLGLLLLALGMKGFEQLKGFAYTTVIFAAVSAAMFYPQYFIQVGDYKLSKLIMPLLQVIMFGMLAGQFIEINFLKMVWDITQIIIIPLAIGFIINQFFKKFAGWLKDYLPLISMAGIAFILLIIIAAGQQSLLNVGGLLIVAVLMHNIGGFILGYSAAKLFRMPEQDCRTVAIEVGLQNGGLASGLANEMKLLRVTSGRVVRADGEHHRVDFGELVGEEAGEES